MVGLLASVGKGVKVMVGVIEGVMVGLLVKVVKGVKDGVIVPSHGTLSS